jgi:hypothetical protein
VTSGSSSSGNGTVIYSVAANTTTASRTAAITIAGNQYTVTQAGLPTCTYALSASSKSFSASAGSGSVGVTAPSGCTWSGSEAASWITLTSGASGTGSGTVAYTVAANTTTSSRMTVLSIAGKIFTVTQAGVTAK